MHLFDTINTNFLKPIDIDRIEIYLTVIECIYHESNLIAILFITDRNNKLF